MSLVMNNNLTAMNAARNLGESYAALSNSVRKMSSGLRVSSSADDAAGLAIRELMRADIAALNQGVRNANDAISVIQTADGALGIIDEKLIRMQELAEQAATGTYNSDQRLMIESEYQAMASEITRIANATDFNGLHLLNGNLSASATVTAAPYGHVGTTMTPTGPLKVHFGNGNDPKEDYYYIAISSSTASALGVGNVAVGAAAATVSTQAAAQNALEGIKTAIISKDKIRANLGALQNRLENTVSNLRIQSENVSAAESQISDVDISSEMTNFVRNQIKVQAGVAMLSQANSLPRMAMSLLQG